MITSDDAKSDNIRMHSELEYLLQEYNIINNFENMNKCINTNTDTLNINYYKTNRISAYSFFRVFQINCTVDIIMSSFKIMKKLESREYRKRTSFLLDFIYFGDTKIIDSLFLSRVLQTKASKRLFRKHSKIFSFKLSHRPLISPFSEREKIYRKALYKIPLSNFISMQVSYEPDFFRQRSLEIIRWNLTDTQAEKFDLILDKITNEVIMDEISLYEIYRMSQLSIDLIEDTSIEWLLTIAPNRSPLDKFPEK